jgi:hypothetical protein
VVVVSTLGLKGKKEAGGDVTTTTMTGRRKIFKLTIYTGERRSTNYRKCFLVNCCK